MPAPPSRHGTHGENDTLEQVDSIVSDSTQNETAYTSTLHTSVAKTLPHLRSNNQPNEEDPATQRQTSL